MAKEKRALADESVRDAAPSITPDVGQRNTLDLTTNLTADPSGAGVILNPDVFDSLAKISSDIHNTRRLSRTADEEKAYNTRYANQELTNFMEWQTQKNEADVTLSKLQMDTQKTWYNLKEQVQRGELTERDMLDKFREEIFTLQGNNEKVGNYYIAEQLNKWGQDLYDRNYPLAVVNDYTRSELKVEASLFADKQVGTIAVSSGKKELYPAIEEYIEQRARMSYLTKTPEDEAKAYSDSQEFYLAQMGQIENYYNNHPELTPDQLKAMFYDLLARGEKTEKPKDDLSNYPAKEIRDGVRQDTEGRFGSWIITTREPSEAERLLLRNAGKPGWPTYNDLMSDENFEKKDGELTGKIKVTWDTSMSKETRDKIIEEMNKLDKSKNLHYSLAQSDYYKRMIGWDKVKSGDILNNPYLQQATFSSAMDEFKNYWAYTDNIILNGTPEQAAKVISERVEIRNKFFPTMSIYSYIRNRQGLGYSQQSTAETLGEQINTLKKVLNDNASSQSLMAGELSLVVGEGDTAIDLMIKDEYLDGSSDLGTQRYAYARELLSALETTRNQLLLNPGSMAQINPQVSDKYIDLQQKMSPYSFIITNEDGSYSTNENKLSEAKQSFEDTMTHAKYAGDSSSVVYMVGKVAEEASAVVKRLPGKEREEVLYDYGKIFGSDILSVSSTSNWSKDAQNTAATIGMYQFASHVQVNSNFIDLIKKNRAEGIVSADPNYIKTIVKDRKIKIKNGDLTTIDKLIAEKIGKAQYIPAARALAYNLIAAAIANGDTEFDMNVFSQMLDENFQGKEYKFASVYDTSKIYTPASSSGPTENTLQGYEGYKKTMDAAIKRFGISQDSVSTRDDGTGGLSVIRGDKTKLTAYGANGEKVPFVISKEVAPGVDGTTALKAKTGMLVLANNAYDLTNTKNPKIFTKEFETWVGVSPDTAQRDAMQVLSTLNDPAFQKTAQEFFKNPSNFNIDTKSGITRYESLIAAGGSRPDVAPNPMEGASGFWDTLKKAWKATALSSDGDTGSTLKDEQLKDPDAKQQVMLYRLAKAYHANPQKVSTMTYTNEYYSGSKQPVKVGQSFTPYPGAKGFTITSDYGPRTDPVTKKPGSFHHGQDFAAPEGTPWKAAFSGTITFVGDRNDGFGTSVEMTTDAGYKLKFSHFKPTLPSGIKSGVYVKAGNLIGYVGSTGKSTGPHTDVRTWNAQGKELRYTDLVNGTSAHVEETPEAKASNTRNDTRNMLKRQGYTVTEQELKYLQDAYQGKTFDENDAKICGRSFGEAQKSVDNLDPKSDYHKMRVYGQELALLKYKVFDKNQPEYAIAAMKPGVTFRYVQSGTNKVLNNMSGLSGKQILNKYKSGELKNLPKNGVWVPENTSAFDAAISKYRSFK